MKTNNVVDIIKIGKISTKKEIDKYNVNEDLLNGNMLFHYLILTNNLKGLKLAWHPVYRFNNDGLNGYMLAAKEHRYDILLYLLKEYHTSVYLTNNQDANILHFIDPSIPEYIDIMKTKIKWENLFDHYNTVHIAPIDILFSQGTYNNISYVIDNIDIDYKAFDAQPFSFSLLNNRKLKQKQIINILSRIYKINHELYDEVDDFGYNIAFPIILNGYYDVLQYIVKKKGSKLDRYSPISASHIFLVAYRIGVKLDDYKMAKLIVDRVMKHHDFMETDGNGNNMAHFILNSRLINKKGNDYIEDKILSQYKMWGKNNINKITPFDIIIKLDYDKYHKYVTNRPENTNINNKKWRKFADKLPIQYNDTNVNILEAPYVHANMFQARFTDIAIFCMYLKEKYKDLYLPIYYGKDVKPDWDDDISLPDDMLYDYNNFPWLIVWNNEDLYFIHPYLNKLIKENKDKYKYSFVILSIRLPDGGLHAALLFYDFERNKIERFDPYGNVTVLDGNMDKIFAKELTKGTGMTYCSPECYFPVAGFQTISDENNILNQKMGDFGGYCLAWSLWYIEHKINNDKIKTNDLINKTMNRFMSINIKPMEYIRNYANYISRYRLNYLNKIGIPPQLTSNSEFDVKYVKILQNAIIEYHEK